MYPGLLGPHDYGSNTNMRNVSAFFVAWRFGLFLCLWAIICLPFSARAQSVLFYAGGLPPYIELHEQGEPTGFAVDLMRAVMREAGVPEDDISITVLPWARAVSGVQHTPGTALLCLALLPERLDEYKWVGPVDYMAVGLFAADPAQVPLKRQADIYRYRIGVVRQTALLNSLRNSYPGIEKNFEEVRSITAQLRMLKERRVDLIAQSILGIRLSMERLAMPVEDYPLVGRLEPLKMYFGFNNSFSDTFIARLQAGLDRLKKRKNGQKSRYDRLKEKYFK